MDKPLIISFYTVGTPYQLEIFNLISSCHTLGLDHQIEGIESRGSWEDNCAHKPFFIYEMLKKHRRPVFWIDADAVFMRKPDFSLFEQADIAVRFVERFAHDIRFRICTASLFCNYTPKALAIMDKWCRRCQQILDQGRPAAFLEQVFIWEILQEEKEATIAQLPVGYCKIFDLDEVAENEIVVEQRQASRRFREIVNG